MARSSPNKSRGAALATADEFIQMVRGVVERSKQPRRTQAALERLIADGCAEAELCRLVVQAAYWVQRTEPMRRTGTKLPSILDALMSERCQEEVMKGKLSRYLRQMVKRLGTLQEVPFIVRDKGTSIGRVLDDCLDTSRLP